MELVQGLGYIYPDNQIIPYLLMAHTTCQQLVYFSFIVYNKRRSFCYHEYKHIYNFGLVTILLTIPRFFATPVIPCQEVFCSLYDDITPRCIINKVPHITWSVPMGYTFNQIYMTPTIYTHFLLFFFFPLFVDLKKTAKHGLLMILLKIFFFVRSDNSMSGDRYVDTSSNASIWCFIGVLIQYSGLMPVI